MSNGVVKAGHTIAELTAQGDGRPVVVPFGETPTPAPTAIATGGRPVVSFGGSSEIGQMLAENKNKTTGDPLGLNTEEFKEKVNKSIEKSADTFIKTAENHSAFVAHAIEKEEKEKKLQSQARKEIVGDEGAVKTGGYHPSNSITPKEEGASGIEVVDALEDPPVEVVGEQEDKPVVVVNSEAGESIDDNPEEGPWLKTNVFTKAAKKAGQSILKRKKGASVDIYLPASNLVMRFYAINTVLRATQLSKRVIEYGLYFDDYRVLETIFEHSEILAADGDKIEFGQWLEIIHNDDINLVYLGSIMATTGDKNLDVVILCGDCGSPVKVGMNYAKLYTDNITDDIKAAARLYDPARTIAELQKNINMGQVRTYSWKDNDGYTYTVSMTAASKHKDLTISELAKEWLVRVNYDALTDEIAKDRSKTTTERLAWLHNAKPQLIQDYLPLISMSILIDKISVFHESNPTRHEIVRTSEKYGDIMEAINDLGSDVLNKIDEEMFKFIPKNKMTLITRQYHCNSCNNDTVSVIDKMNHMYFLEMMRVIHG